MWAIATIVGLWIAAETKVGPVLVKVTGKHGLHLGDLAGFLVCWQWAAVVTVATGRRS